LPLDRRVGVGVGVYQPRSARSLIRDTPPGVRMSAIPRFTRAVQVSASGESTGILQVEPIALPESIGYPSLNYLVSLTECPPAAVGSSGLQVQHAGVQGRHHQARRPLTASALIA